MALLFRRHRRRGLLGLSPAALGAAISRQLPQEVVSHLGSEGVALAAEWVVRIVVSNSSAGNGHGARVRGTSASFVLSAPEVVEEMLVRAREAGLSLTAWEANAIFEAVLSHLRRKRFI